MAGRTLSKNKLKVFFDYANERKFFTMKTKWAIIGAGDIASDRFGPALKKSETSEIIAVVDKNIDAAKKLAGVLDVEHQFTDIEALLEIKNIDAVYVATWPSTHCEIVLKLARAGKNILCEKPLATTLVDCQKMISTCEQNNVKLMVGQNMRFNNAHMMVKQFIEEKRIGDIRMIKAEFFTSMIQRWGSTFKDTFRFDIEKGGGGLILDMGIHVIDLVRYLVGKEVVSVHSYHSPMAYNLEVEDTAMISLQFSDGSYGSITLSGGIPYGRNGVEIYSENGAIITEGSMARTPSNQRVRLFADGKWDEYELEANDAFLGELQHFEACLKENRTPQPTGLDGAEVLAVALAAYASQKKEGTVAPEKI
jgi:predicted dehydrogenase